MSYDLAAFDLQREPEDRAVFLAWFKSRTTWLDGVDYHAVSNATPRLQSWFRDIARFFPPMTDLDSARPGLETEYCICPDLIYAAFQAGMAAFAFETAFALAARHGVGLYCISDEGDVWVPSEQSLVKSFQGSRAPSDRKPRPHVEEGIDELLAELQRRAGR